MMTGINRQFRLAARPVGVFKDSDFELARTPVPVPGEGELLVKVTHLSIDPAMRGWMNAGHVTPVEVGAVMRAITIGQVVNSRHPGFTEGDFVHGRFGVQEFALSDGTGVYKVHPGDGRSLAAYLGVLGMTGMTAYFGLLDVGRLAAGDVVLVSGAAGAVGSVAGQIAKTRALTSSESPAVPRNAACSSTVSGSALPSTTNVTTFSISCATTPPDTSTCSSTTSVGIFSTRESLASLAARES